LKSVWVGAGIVPAVLHRCLSLCAHLVRLGVLPTLLPLAGIMYTARNRLSWGENRGGMFVAVSGWDANGNLVEREWHAIADGDDGPFIPAMAASAVVGHVLDGRRPIAGARAGIADVALADYETQFASRRIFTGMRERSAQPQSLYRRLLGTAYHMLPPTLQRLHELDRHLVAEGRAKVERGKGILARLIGAAVGFPPAGTDIPVIVDFRWRARSGSAALPAANFSALRKKDKAVSIGCCASGSAQPHSVWHWLSKRADCSFACDAGTCSDLRCRSRWRQYEYEDQGRFHFFVDVGLKWIGLLVRYQGWLELRPNIMNGT
jgi:hypothetical protein